ncbi:hypothetical protein [Acaryochloris marina]|uniref:hypothetical protein n=1 Tax=Acaryochloris marina TaxID=155978 RepID=UPI001BAE8AF0|nr:hypothetical protein [Acaryochloris marina]QUY45754.1 hypothetical protein I1H34_28795 [Acaryochloris marina S15]
MPFARRTKKIKVPNGEIIKPVENVEAAVLNKKMKEKELSYATVYVKWKYICPECDAEVRPYAIRPECIVNPRFRLKSQNDDPHRENCPIPIIVVQDDEDIDEDASEADNRPLCEYPNRLLLDSFDETSQDTEITSQKRSQYDDRVQNNLDTPKDRIVYSIHVLVEYFLESKCLEENLSIHGVKENTYGTVFKQIIDFEDPSLSRPRIYYSQVIYKNVGIFDDRIEFYLTDNGFDQENQPIKKSIVKLKISDWEELDRQKFLEKIERFKSGLYLKNKNKASGESRYHTWIFFLGVSSSENNSEFRLLRDSWKLVDLCITNKLDTLPYYQSFYEYSELSGSTVVPISQPEVEPELITEMPEPVGPPENKESTDTSQDTSPDDDESQESGLSGEKQKEISEAINRQITPFSHEKSLFEKLQSLSGLLAILLVLFIAGLAINGVIEENNRDNQPTEEVK